MEINMLNKYVNIQCLTFLIVTICPLFVNAMPYIHKTERI